MKLPAVAITAAFAGGIVFGSGGFFAARVSGPWALRGLFLAAALALVGGLVLLARGHLRAAAALALSFWAVLGAIAARVALEPPPANHVLTLLDARRIPLDAPLRWAGRLRDEPRDLPWDQGLEVALSKVEIEGHSLALTGGMRLTFPAEARAAGPLPELHAGDEIEFITQARLPQLYRDPGAFDRREYLARQGIHLTATLSAPELIERIVPAPTSLPFILARARARLRTVLASLFPAAPEAARCSAPCCWATRASWTARNRGTFKLPAPTMFW